MKSTLPTVALSLAGILSLTAMMVQAQAGAGAKGSWVYIGTRGAAPPPTASAEQIEAYKNSPQGIYAAHLDSETGKLTLLGIQIPLPGVPWLVVDPLRPLIYSLDVEGGQDSPNNIHSFAVDTSTGKLKQLNQVVSGAPDTTDLVLDTKSNTLFGASYGAGDVTALPILPDGTVGNLASAQQDLFDSSTLPASPRQKSLHAHGVIIDPTGHYVFSADFGADRLFIYRFDPATRTLSRGEPTFIQFPRGTAPRHLAFHPNGKFLYMNSELSAELFSYRWDAKAGRLQPIQKISLYPAGYTGANKSTAEALFCADGRFLYVSLRGDQDSIVVYSVNRENGTLQEVQRIHSQGKAPWSIGIDPTGRWMIIANSTSKSVTEMSVDQSTGKLTPTSESFSVPTPDTLVFKAD